MFFTETILQWIRHTTSQADQSAKPLQAVSVSRALETGRRGWLVCVTRCVCRFEVAMVVSTCCEHTKTWPGPLLIDTHEQTYWYQLHRLGFMWREAWSLEKWRAVLCENKVVPIHLWLCFAFNHFFSLWQKVIYISEALPTSFYKHSKTVLLRANSLEILFYV